MKFFQIAALLFAFIWGQLYASEAEDAESELGHMLNNSSKYSDQMILEKAAEIQERYPGTSQSQFASHIAEMLSSKPKSVESSNLKPLGPEGRARTNLYLFYEDPIDSTKHYRHSYNEGKDHPIEIRLSISKTKKHSLNVRFKSKSDGWIFFDTVHIRCGEKIRSFKFPANSIYRHVVGPRVVSEVATLKIQRKELKTLQCLAQNPAKKVIRFEGQHVNTFHLSEAEIEAIRDMLIVRDLINQNKL